MARICIKMRFIRHFCVPSRPVCILFRDLCVWSQSGGDGRCPGLQFYHRRTQTTSHSLKGHHHEHRQTHGSHRRRHYRHRRRHQPVHCRRTEIARRTGPCRRQRRRCHDARGVCQRQAPERRRKSRAVSPAPASSRSSNPPQAVGTGGAPGSLQPWQQSRFRYFPDEPPFFQHRYPVPLSRSATRAPFRPASSYFVPPFRRLVAIRWR